MECVGPIFPHWCEFDYHNNWYYNQSVAVSDTCRVCGCFTVHFVIVAAFSASYKDSIASKSLHDTITAISTF